MAGHADKPMVRLAMYKGKGKLDNAFIRLWTGSVYSHCELVVGEWSYSSSRMDGGVRKKVIYFDSDRWELVDLPWVSEKRILEYFNKTHHHAYGWWELITSQFLNLGVISGNAQFCSMWCANAIGIPNAPLHSPFALYKLCLWLTKRWQYVSS